MKKYFIIFFILSYQLVIAQNFEIGTRIRYIDCFNDIDYQSQADIQTDTIDWKYRSFSGDIIGDYDLKSNLFFRIRFGYLYAGYDNSNVWHSTNGNSISVEKDLTANQFDIGFGFGRNLTFNRFRAKIGLELFYYFPSMMKSNEYQHYYNSTGTLYQRINVSKTEPGQQSIGLHLITSVQYNLCKSLYLSLDIINYVHFAYNKSEVITQYDYIDSDGNITKTEIERKSTNLRAVSTNFLTPAVGLYYMF